MQTQPTPPKTSKTEDFRTKASLLREVVKLLMGELSLVSDGRWVDLPEHKKKKVILASRLGVFDWRSNQMDREPFDLTRLKSLIRDLEDQSRRKIQAKIDLVGNQILALQEQHQYLLECLNISFRKFDEPAPAH